jgi:hypothetical protein
MAGDWQGVVGNWVSSEAAEEDDWVVWRELMESVSNIGWTAHHRRRRPSVAMKPRYMEMVVEEFSVLSQGFIFSSLMVLWWYVTTWWVRKTLFCGYRVKP